MWLRTRSKFTVPSLLSSSPFILRKTSKLTVLVLGFNATHLLFCNGASWPLQADGVPDLLNNPSLLDQLAQRYPIGPDYGQLVKDPHFDPGRVRCLPLFKQMVCSPSERVREPSLH